MEGFKGTPGPWVWQSENGGGFWHWLGPVNCSPLDRVADDGSAWGEYGASIEVDSADAKLIAAAPELLEALQEAMKFSISEEAYNKCAGAVSKALGQ